MSRREQISSVPHSATVKIRPTQQVDSLHELMHKMSLIAQDRGHETIEEADDFNIGDDYDPTSPWEEQFDPSGDSLGFLATGLRKPQLDESTSAPAPKEQKQVESNVEEPDL